MSAVSERERETAEDLTAPDSSVEDVMGAAYPFLWGLDMEVESTEVTDETDETATVRVTFVNVEDDYHDTDSFDLRQTDGEWRIWDYNAIN
jgi:hypothetical protein